MLEIIIRESKIPVIVDAGIGAPSHAAKRWRWVLMPCSWNTAIAVANDPVMMARAFKLAVEAGRMAVGRQNSQ